MDEIFDFLPLRDLHAIAQTRKSLHYAAGEFFQRNYSALDINANENNEYSAFNDFVETIYFQELSQVDTKSIKGKAVKKLPLYFEDGDWGSDLSNRQLEKLKGSMEQIEELHLGVDVLYEKDRQVIHDVFPSLKRLRVRGMFDWLTHDGIDDALINPNMEIFNAYSADFIPQFPNLRAFACDETSLLLNKYWFTTTGRTIRTYRWAFGAK